MQEVAETLIQRRNQRREQVWLVQAYRMRVVGMYKESQVESKKNNATRSPRMLIQRTEEWRRRREEKEKKKKKENQRAVCVMLSLLPKS